MDRSRIFSYWSGPLPAALEDCHFPEDVCLLEIVVHIMEHFHCNLCDTIDGSLVYLHMDYAFKEMCKNMLVANLTSHHLSKDF